MITWLTNHWQEITDAAAAVVITARLILKFIPSPTAGSKFESFVTLLKHAGLHIPDAPVATPPTPPTV